MSEMVERVANAIWTAEEIPVVDDDWDAWRQQVARAAIEAMRDPTQPMIDAFYRLDDFGSPTGCGEGWDAMISAALESSLNPMIGHNSGAEQ